MVYTRTGGVPGATAARLGSQNRASSDSACGLGPGTEGLSDSRPEGGGDTEIVLYPDSNKLGATSFTASDAEKKNARPRSCGMNLWTIETASGRRDFARDETFYFRD